MKNEYPKPKLFIPTKEEAERIISEASKHFSDNLVLKIENEDEPIKKRGQKPVRKKDFEIGM